MKQELYNFDVYPKVMLAGEKVRITVKPMGWHAGIAAGKRYTVLLTAAEDGDEVNFPEWALSEKLPVTAEADNCLRFDYVFPSEQEYFLRVLDAEDNLMVTLNVYALDRDMKGRYPWRGDLHVHTRRSDGREAPAVVCANYRRAGYDFMVVSDHKRYYPSLEAIEAFRGVAPGFTLVAGEEVHLPLTNVHIVNFGGHYSINSLVERDDVPEDIVSTERRSEYGECPPILSRAEYEAQIAGIAKKKWFGAPAADTSFAVCCWAFDRIREAGGLGIFCHPYWRIRHGYQIPERFIRTMLREHPFDAFEVLGGERYFEHNGLQTAIYYEELARGNSFPIVGSTDTHGSTEHNPGGFICSTIVFAPDNSREALMSGVRAQYTVAVDTISKEFRLVGSLRLQKYACFLMNNFYPLHDRLCAIEGEYLLQYVTGATEAKARLDAVANDLTALREKYFAL